MFNASMNNSCAINSVSVDMVFPFIIVVVL